MASAPLPQAVACEQSALQLRQAYADEHDGAAHWAFAAPAMSWTTKDISLHLQLGLEAFQVHTGPASVHLSEAARDGGRYGMTLVLEAALVFLTKNLPARNLDTLAPLERLLDALKDLNDGVTDRSLKASGSGGHKHSRTIIDFKARCLLASEMLQIHSLEKSAADTVIAEKVRQAARLVGLKLGNPRRGVSEETTLENWRRDERRDGKARQRDNSRTDTLSCRLALLREEMKVRVHTALSIQHLLDMILDPVLPKPYCPRLFD